MFWYRCPSCSIVLQAPEIRAGKTTVCSKCLQPLTIPADHRLWLNEKGEPLLASPTMVTSSPPPAPFQRTPAFDEIELPADQDDVLRAIARGEIAPANAPLPIVEPQSPPAPSFSRSLPVSDPDDGRVDLYPPTPVAEPPRAVPRRPSPAATNPPVPTPPPGSPAPTPPPRRTEPEPAWAATSSSGSRARRLVCAEPADGERGVAVALEKPLRLRTEMDIAVDLTSALATRMKPPPRPPRDLKPSTAVWILTTGLALALLTASLISSNNFIEAALAIGAAQALAGYAWVTALAFRRDLRRGIACALPPLTFVYLTNWKYA